MNLFTRNSPYYRLLKYLLFLLKHPVYRNVVFFTLRPLWPRKPLPVTYRIGKSRAGLGTGKRTTTRRPYSPKPSRCNRPRYRLSNLQIFADKNEKTLLFQIRFLKMTPEVVILMDFISVL